MPKEAARLFLRVTDVRVERLQKMTDDDFVCDFGVCREAIQAVGRDALAISFWDSTIKKPADRALYGWAANPWVWETGGKHMKTKITKQLTDKPSASRPVYRWKVSPPPGSQFGAVKVAAYTRYEAMIAAAKLWRTPWTPIARECVIENLGAVKSQDVNKKYIVAALELAIVLLVTQITFVWAKCTALLERGYTAYGGEYLSS